MPRRDRDDRPAIEVFGGAPDLTSEQTIDVGGGSGSNRRWWLLVAVAVAVIAGTVIFGAGDGEEGAMPTTTTTVRRSTTSTSSTLPAPLGPLLPTPTGGALVFAKNDSRWVVVDLDTGEQRHIGPLPAPTDLYGGVVAVQGGLVVVGSGVATYIPVLADAPGAALGEASAVIPSGDPARVWLVRLDVEGTPIDVRLVDLVGRVLARRGVPASYLNQATVDGLLTSGGGRVYLVGRDGVRSLGVGTPSSVHGSTVVIDTCDDRARCGPELVDTSTGARRRVEGLWGPFRYAGQQSLLMADGSLLETTYGPNGIVLRWAGPKGELLGVGRDPGGRNPVSDFYESGLYFNGEPAGLPGGLGALWLQGDQKVARLYPDGRGGIQVDQLPTPPGVRADRVFVVMP